MIIHLLVVPKVVLYNQGTSKKQKHKPGHRKTKTHTKPQIYPSQNYKYLYLLFLMGTGKCVSWVTLALGLSEGTDEPELSTWTATSFED